MWDLVGNVAVGAKPGGNGAVVDELWGLGVTGDVKLLYLGIQYAPVKLTE